MRDESAKFTHVNGRHPNLGDQTGDKKTSKSPNIVFVGLDPRGGDKLDLVRIGDGDLSYERSEDVIECPSVGSGLNDNSIGRLQVLLSPVGKTVDVNAAEREHDLHLMVQAAEDDVVLMGVNGDEAFKDLARVGVHSTLLYR